VFFLGHLKILQIRVSWFPGGMGGDQIGCHTVSDMIAPRYHAYSEFISERPGYFLPYYINGSRCETTGSLAKHSTRTVAVPSAQGRTVRAQGPDGPRPGARRGSALCTGADGPRAGAGRSAAWCEARAPASWPDGPRPGAGRSARAQGGGRSPAVSGSRSREGPRRGGEILGVV
jgi:hypothetical protein